MRFLSIIIFLFPIFGFGQTSKSVQPVVCTEECEFEAVYEVKEIEVPIYTGKEDDLTVKRDIYHINLEGGETKRIAVVLDLYKTESYKMTKFRKRVQLRSDGFKETREVLCPEKVTANLLKQIQLKLLKEDFLPKGYEPLDDFKLEVKNALVQYQRAKGLPIGHLDFETLEFMEVDLNEK